MAMRRGRGYQRQPEITLADAFAALRSDYNAAKTSRFRKRLTGTSAMGSGGDYHYRSEADYLRMMELARSFDRNDMIVGQGVTRLVDNALQAGIAVEPQTGDEETDVILGRRWQDWSEDAERCHKPGELTFHEQARLALRQTIVDGDVCFLPLEDGSLEPVEGHRLRTPRNTRRNVVHGVLLDDDRRRLAYWFTKSDVDPNRAVYKVSEIKEYPARDADGHRLVFHIYNPKRLSQTRGVTAFAPIVDAIGMHDDIQFAKLIQQQIVSCFSVFHERPLDYEGDDQIVKGESETETLSDGSTRTIEGIAPGMEIFGTPGEKLQGFSPNVPNPEFFQHAGLILTIIAINLNLPLQVLLLDAKQTNFSGWRGAIDQARTGFRQIQGWMINRFYRPVYLWKVRQWLTGQDAAASQLRRAAGAEGINILGHKFSPPIWPYIEPNKDAQADTAIIRGGLNSRRAVLAQRGIHLPDVDRERIADNKNLILMAVDAADEINAQHPDAGVDWRELVGFDAKGRKLNSTEQRR